MQGFEREYQDLEFHMVLNGKSMELSENWRDVLATGRTSKKAWCGSQKM